MKVKRDGPYDWRPPYASAEDVTSGEFYVRAVFGTSGTSSIVLSTDSVLLPQISDASANDKVFYIGGRLIDPTTKGWQGSSDNRTRHNRIPIFPHRLLEHSQRSDNGFHGLSWTIWHQRW